MMLVPLNPDTRRRVVASGRLLLSDNPGEVVAASRALRGLPMGRGDMAVGQTTLSQCASLQGHCFAN